MTPDVVAMLKASANQTIKKVWGVEYVIVDTDLYTSKILEIHPGFECSLHYHIKKQETFTVLSGFMRLELTGKVAPIGRHFILLSPGESWDIIPGTEHRFSSLLGSDVLEISTKHLDSDVVRLEESRAL